MFAGMMTTSRGKDIEINWIKFGAVESISFVGKDYVVLGFGNYIVFVDTSHPDRKEIVYRATNDLKGDGVQCLCAHKFMSCFAFAEKCRRPRIMINAFPSFDTIKVIEGCQETNYIAMGFSEVEYLIALTGLPWYKIIIWNWRTLEKLYIHETNFRFPVQFLRVSMTLPMYIAQLSPMEKTFNLWEMNACYKRTAVSNSVVTLPKDCQPPLAYAWGFDGDLYFVDSGGDLYSMNPESKACELVFPWKGDEGKAHPCLTLYKGGWVYTGPNKVQFCRRKSPEGWVRVWSFVPAAPLKALISSSFRETLAAWSEEHELVLIKGEQTVETSTIRSYGCSFDFVCFIQPVADFIVTFSNLRKTLFVWNKATGVMVSIFDLSQLRYVNDMKTSPVYPFAVFAQSTGKVNLLSLYDPKRPLYLMEMYLTKDSIDLIRFHSKGYVFCVANVENGHFFLMKVQDSKLEVMAHTKLDLKIVSFDIVGHSEDVKLVVLPMSQLCCRSGQNLLVYHADLRKETFTYVEEVTMPFVISAMWPRDESTFFCVPHRSRMLYVIKLKGEPVVSKSVSGHQMKAFGLNSDGHHLLTYGFDGLLIMRVAKTLLCLTVLMPSHRMGKGIKNAVADPYCQTIVSLGVDGTMISFTYSGGYTSPSNRYENELFLKGPQCKQVLITVQISFKSKGKFGKQVEEGKEMSEATLIVSEKTWLEMKEELKIEAEKHHSRKEKAEILLELGDIRQMLKDLLDANFEASSYEMLPIQSFDLDKATRRKKMEDGKTEREKEKHMQLATIKARDQISEYIKKFCWDFVDTKGRQIHGIVSNMAVESYPTLQVTEEEIQNLFWEAERIKIEQCYRKSDFFDPWVPRSPSMLELHLNVKAHISDINVAQTVKTKFEEDELDEQNKESDSTEKDFHQLWSGAATHKFLENLQSPYTQFEMGTYQRSEYNLGLVMENTTKLMQWFNDKFNEMFAVKEREVAIIVEKNNRLRHIINELKFFNFSPHICSTIVLDPIWSPYEQPERIMKVEDDELPVKPYISPSQQELIDRRAAEEERIRLRLLADDFKERALIVMMDGVLEKLWENEIKKDVPKPKCLSEKEPENYTEDDIKAIRAYEEAVKFLMSERERYRKMLEADWAKIVNSIKDVVNRFDDRLTKLQMLKMRVQSAIGQETLKVLRTCLGMHAKMELTRKEDNMRQELIKNEKKIELLQSELLRLQESLGDCRNHYETLQNRDRNMDRNFKKELPDISPVLIDQLYKASKKRPKLPQKAALYSSLLTDIGRCVVSGVKPEYLTSECIQYLKDMDSLDSYVNAPASVAEQPWEVMCKLRRSKVECELKIRACAVDLGEAEATVSTYQKKLKMAREFQTHLHNEIHALRYERLLREQNFAIQLVLKSGSVEIPLSGRISDFDECILVSNETLTEINDIIGKAGNQKIRAMQKAANFRKGIIFKEWEHKKLRMEIEDLQRHLRTVENIKVTKELQSILIGRARGFTDEKGFLYLEEEISAAKERLNKATIELNRAIDEVNLKIERIRTKNNELDGRIAELNVDVNELSLEVDKEFDKKELDKNIKRMKRVRFRSKLVQKIQEQHNEILMLQTELELLRLRTFPTLKNKP